MDLLASADAAAELEAVLRREARPGPQPPQPDGDGLQPVEDKANDIPNWNNSDTRQLIRGFFVLRPDAGHGGQAGSLTAGAPASNPTDGDTVQLQVRVHNYSLDTAATDVPVEFWAVARDADDENNAGAPFKLGTVTLDTIPALGWVPANFLWSTTGRAPAGAQLYRIFVIVARNDPKNPNDPWNNVIHAWADRYDDPATVDGTPSSDRLVDPFTGQLETLEAGQNKQGWFEVTISPQGRRPRPAGRHGRAPAPAGGPAPVRQRRRPRHPRPAPAPGPPTACRHRRPRRQRPGGARPPGRHRPRRATPSATTATTAPRCMVYEGAPEQGGRLVGMKRVTGLAGSGPAGRWVTLPWTPRERRAAPARRPPLRRLHGPPRRPGADHPGRRRGPARRAPGHPGAPAGGGATWSGSPPTCGRPWWPRSRRPTPPPWPATSPGPGRP